MLQALEMCRPAIGIAVSCICERARSADRILRLRPHQLDLIRRTVASDCSNQEFDLFIEAAERYGLNPFRRQIMPLVFGKDFDKRRMVIVIGIDGQRMIAQRSGNYRPASEPTKFVENRRKRGPTNPLGLVLARVTLFQQDRGGEWFPVVGEALLGRVRADQGRMGGGPRHLAGEGPATKFSMTAANGGKCLG